MTYPTTADVKITINGTDRTSSIPTHSLSIQDVLTHQMDTASFEVRDGGAFGLAELQEVIITDQAETTRYFAGFISAINSLEDYPAVHYQITAVDYSFLLEKAIINNAYEGDSDYTIINSMFSGASPDLSGDIDTTTDVETILSSIDRLVFNRLTVRQALEIIAGISGGDWYVDYGPGAGGALANLHYFSSLANPAPYSLSNAPDLSTSFPFSGLVENKSAGNVANRITIVGGQYLSDDATFEFEGNANQTRFVIPFKMQGPAAGGGVQVDVNSGTDGSPSWSSKTVGTGYLDELGTYDVLYYFAEKVIEFNVAPHVLNRSWRIVGRYEVPLRARVQDDASIIQYGRYLDKLIVDQTIEDKNTAKQRGRIELANNAVANPTYRCSVREPGLRSGMSIRLTHSGRGIDADYLIQRVTTHWIGGGYVEYLIELGLYRPDLIDIILGLKRNQPKPDRRADDVLDEILLVSEDVDATDSPTSTERGPGYKWAPSTPSQTKLIWNFGTWG